MLKKISSLFIIGTLFMQMLVPVHAEETNVIYKLNLENHPLGTLTEGATGVSDQGIVEVKQEDDGSKYVSVVDNSTDTVGFSHTIKGSKDNDFTVSFDYRRVGGGANVRCTGPNHLVLMALVQKPTYYITVVDEAGNSSNSLQESNGYVINHQWTNITIVFRVAKNTYDVYQDGKIIIENVPFRNEFTSSQDIKLQLSEGKFDFKNYVEYKGRVIPEPSDEILGYKVNPDRTLVDYKDSYERLNAALGGAVAMTVGNSVARVDNEYVNMDSENPYVAPFMADDGTILAPAEFLAESLGLTYTKLSDTSFSIKNDSATIQYTVGSNNASVNGTAQGMTAAPVYKNGRFYVPVSFTATVLGKNVFLDDRGLVVISDEQVIQSNDEDIIKPLITDIRNHTTLFGNKKYSDVNFSPRSFRADGYGGELGSIDATKRFMGTFNRWSYETDGENHESFTDLGILLQGSINGSVLSGSADRLDPKSKNSAVAVSLEGTALKREVNGQYWGCVCNPNYAQDLKDCIDKGIANGIFSWQLDDGGFNLAHENNGCFCNYCNEQFSAYVRTNMADSVANAIGFDRHTFDFNEYLNSIGITKSADYVVHSSLVAIRTRFYTAKAAELQASIYEYLKEKNNYFSKNFNDLTIKVGDAGSIYYMNTTDGLIGETKSANTSAAAIFAGKLIHDSIGVDMGISPVPKDPGSIRLTRTAIPMAYALGTYVLVPWDTWLYGSTKYYSDLSDLEGSYELPREYPYLFDNYEAPEHIGYVFDLNENDLIVGYSKKLLDKGIPARGIPRTTGSVKKSDSDETYDYTFDETQFDGLAAVIATGKLPNLTDSEQAVINNSGVTFVSATDTSQITELEKEWWMVRSNDSEVSTTLRTNQLYDNAPVVVHAVNYGAFDKENTQIEINNKYLPAGDTLTVNIYKPWENPETITVQKGDGSTVIKLDCLNIWSVLEICGEGTVRQGASFDIGNGYSGIGMGTRISNDKATGTPDSFTITTYSEGINSTTYGDTTGTQDEAAFVYKRISGSRLRSSGVQAGFDDHDGAHGVMIRDGIYTNARFVALMYDEANGLRLAKRHYTNKGVVYTTINSGKHKYMKLERSGYNYIALVSDDGVSYEQVASVPMYFEAPVAGVFASSPDGSKSECGVKDFLVTDGSFNDCTITKFNIGYEDGTISEYKIDASLESEIATAEFSKLNFADFDMTFTSSNEDVIKVGPSGQLIPVSSGTATITAVAKCDAVAGTATALIEVLERPVMHEENFNDDEWPEYMPMESSKGAALVEDGTLKLMVTEDNNPCDVKFSIDQPNVPTVIEFDFKAHFGNTYPGGARVIYANDMTGMALTAGRTEGFMWFYGNKQTKIMDIEEDKWYHIRLEADYDDQTADLYIDGDLIVENGQCRGALAPNGYMWVGGYSMGIDTCFQWDNFKFYKTSDLSVSVDGYKTDEMTNTLYYCPVGITVAEFLGKTAVYPNGATLAIYSSDKVQKSATDRVEKNDLIKVTYSKDRTYKYFTIVPALDVEVQGITVNENEYYEASKILEPGVATVRARLSNYKDTDETVTVYAAVLGDRLSDLKRLQSITVPANGTNDFDFEISLPDGSENGKIRIMVVENGNLLKPACVAETKLVSTSQITRMPNIFSDNMVLQRGEPVNIFGMAPTGTAIEVTFGNNTITGTAENGKFCLQLPAMEASSEGRDLVVTAGDTTFTYTGVVVGEVLYGSGQSNMQMLVSEASGAKNLGMIDNLRYFTAAPTFNTKGRVDDTVEEQWLVADSDNWDDVSAVMHSVAYYLRNLGAISADVPIGIINVSHNGSSIAAWLSADKLQNCSDTAYYTNYLNKLVDNYGVRPTDLFSSMAKYITPYTVKAAVWYQGEADLGLDRYNLYQDEMISLMRAQFGKADLPYYIVQLPGYTHSKYPDFRLTQWESHDPKNNVHVVVTNDTGDKRTMRPQDKDKVGERLARQIAYNTYGMTNTPYQGPVLKSVSAETSGKSKTITISFDNVGDGLHGGLCSLATGSSITGFETSTDGIIWEKATATLSGNAIEISLGTNSTEKYVRYGYFSEPFNGLGSNTDEVLLPMAPFIADIPKEGGF